MPLKPAPMAAAKPKRVMEDWYSEFLGDEFCGLSRLRFLSLCVVRYRHCVHTNKHTTVLSQAKRCFWDHWSVWHGPFPIGGVRVRIQRWFLGVFCLHAATFCALFLTYPWLNRKHIRVQVKQGGPMKRARLTTPTAKIAVAPPYWHQELLCLRFLLVLATSPDTWYYEYDPGHSSRTARLSIAHPGIAVEKIDKDVRHQWMIPKRYS